MSESNGKQVDRILSLEAARTVKQRKGNDFITVQQAYDLIIQECAKVHEYYLTQIPGFTARMIQDALMSYGLVQLKEGVTLEGAEGAAGSTPTGVAHDPLAGGDATASPDPVTPPDVGGGLA